MFGGAFQRAVASAADFEEAVNAAAAVMGEDPRRPGLQAQMYSATSLLSPLEALLGKERHVYGSR